MPRANKSQKYDYLIRYVNEAAEARLPLLAMCERATLAYKQCPLHNTYRENADQYVQNIGNGNPEVVKCLKHLCNTIPDATNDTVFNAVETWVSMAMGGAQQFEYEPADEYAEKDPALVDRLASLAKYFHDDNKIDSLLPKATRKLVMQGQANFYLEPLDGSRFKVSLIDAYKMLHDPRASKTNRARFTGFTEVKAWSEVKAEIYKKGYGYMLKTINDVDQYIDELSGAHPYRWEDEITADLNTFKSIYAVDPVGNSKSVDKDGKEVSPKEPGYKGEDVEVAYIWDLISNVYAVIINRRFIVQIEDDKLKKTLDVKYYDSEGNEKTRPDTVRIDSPIVTIPFIDADWETFPVSPLFYCLDDFDAICSIEAVMNHNLSIMAPITFMSASYDAEQFEKLSQVAGQIVEGTLQTFGVVNKSHDMSACLTAIERREQRIKRMLGATDQFELQAMIGNRATAAETSAMVGAVSQRMNAPLANIETGMSELIQKMFAMTLIYGDKDDITFPYEGSVATLSKEDILGRALIRAKLSSKIKLERVEQGRNALMIMQTLVGIEGINKEELIKTLVPIISQGVVTRQQADRFVQEQQVDPMQILQAQQAVEEAQSAASQNPITPDMLQGMTPQDMQGISDAFGATQQPDYQDQFSQPTVDTGYDNYQQGIESNMSQAPVEPLQDLEF